jgi:hypothetical protein
LFETENEENMLKIMEDTDERTPTKGGPPCNSTKLIGHLCKIIIEVQAVWQIVSFSSFIMMDYVFPH